MQVGDFFGLQLVEHEVAGQPGLGVVVGHGAEEERMFAVFGQAGRGGRGGHGDKIGVLEQGQGGLGGAGTDGADDHGDFVGNQLGGRVGRHFRLALVVLGDHFHLPAEHAARGVGVVNDEFGGVQAGHAVGGQIAGMGTLDADFNGIRSQRGRGHRHAESHCRKQGHASFHLPLLRKKCACGARSA